MSLWSIAWRYLWNRKLTTALTILSVALGVGMISAVLTLREETQRRFEEEGQAFDIVVGSKGNPLQLVLSTVYFMDAPTGNMDYSIFESLKEHEDVTHAFPIAMGDSYKGYRIVGSSPELMDFAPGGRSPYTLAEGRYFEKSQEAVLGAQVARDSGLKIGDTFVGTHGLVQSAFAEVHDDFPYTVVGILNLSGSPNDRAIFCDIQSVWDVHSHCDADHDHDHEHGHDHDHPEVTAVLVKLASPALRFEFKDHINKRSNAMAAIPIMEIQKLYEQLLGTAKLVLLAIGYLVVAISSLSILIGLYMAILQRRRDLAIMRALGATRGEIFGAVIIEAFWVTLLGIIAGWFMGAVTCAVLNHFLVTRIGFHVPAIHMTADLVSAYSAVMLMGLIAGILPAWQAYRSDVARDLSEL
ncbi:MAG: FtsX-like permease family protein [Candidatus Hydrogenedens sp.]|jgi:putative ABC transport system permease protein|nr:FtsX-like permease family protein [Candidatus Hydrogenedens sp.]